MAKSGPRELEVKAKESRFWQTVIVAVLVPLVIAVLGVGYQWWVSQPSLKGQIVFVAFGGETEAPGKRPDGTKRLTVFLFLANGREIPVTPIAFEGEYRTATNEWKPLQRDFVQMDELEMEFISGTGRPYRILFDDAKCSVLTNDIAVPILRERPRAGLIIFKRPVDTALEKGDLGTIRINVLDAFGETHVIGWNRNYASETLLPLFPSAKLVGDPQKPDLPGRAASSVPCNYAATR